MPRASLKRKRVRNKRGPVKSRFEARESKVFASKYASVPEELAWCVYISRLIGQDSDLVLHGGGNTSVKLKMKDIVGEEHDVLFVKASGADLATIEPGGFVGLNLNPLRRLRILESLPDEEMESQLEIHKIASSSMAPSVEALLHAFLPHRYVNHTHADSILILTNQKDGKERILDALGSRVAILPYFMSGLPLAKGVVEAYEKSSDVEAIVLLNHGIFTFAQDARASYEQMIDYVNRAESYIDKKIRGKTLVTPRTDVAPLPDRVVSAVRFAQVARGLCAHRMPGGALRRFYTEIRMEPDVVEASLSKEAQALCKSGVLTPDHVTRTKNLFVYSETIPDDDGELKRIVKESIDGYRDAYDAYFRAQVNARGADWKELDPYPRVFLVAGVGLVSLGFTRKAARVAADIAEHTIRAKLRADAIEAYEPVSDDHVFDMEYWILQQKKLGKTLRPPLEGQVALVTGSGGAIGFGIADRLLAAGAVVALADNDEPRLEKVHSLLAETYDESRIERIVFDVTDYLAVERALVEIGYRLGGIDTVVPNAGIAHVARIEDLDPGKFDQVLAVNLKGTFNTIKASIPIFRRQGTGGNIVVISSKNVFDPGAAFGAYSASKAGAHQISKIAALELAEFGVRVNMINPDAVFGDERVSSKLWDLVGPDRMKSRGLDAEGLQEFYRQRSLLKVRVLAEHVGNAVVFFASEQTPTTGATLTVDGGIPAAFPR
jgi:rhamnose utilization protein RhaD (predicted bifunctional aldolase and dehydrogenase)/NAD(P)-dependent dehydrogenase (short-subunit alcohol dehydrogenase family)